MAKLRLTFRIVGLSPDIVPMARVAKYIDLLAKLYGNETQIHFDSVSTGSVALDMFCDSHEVLNAVYEKNVAVRQGIGSATDLKYYNQINDLLRDDNSYAETIIPDTVACRIVEFPGVKVPKPQDMAPIEQHGSLQGEIILIGGKDSSVSVHLRDPSGDVQAKITVDRTLAKELAKLIFTTVRLNGIGTWYRTAEHEWVMKSFRAQSCEPLTDESLLDVIAKARLIPSAEWDAVENPYDELRKLRD